MVVVLLDATPPPARASLTRARANVPARPSPLDPAPRSVLVGLPFPGGPARTATPPGGGLGSSASGPLGGLLDADPALKDARRERRTFAIRVLLALLVLVGMPGR